MKFIFRFSKEFNKDKIVNLPITNSDGKKIGTIISVSDSPDSEFYDCVGETEDEMTIHLLKGNLIEIKETK